MYKRFALATVLLMLPATLHCSGESEDTSAANTDEGDEQDLVQQPTLTFGTWKSPVCEKVNGSTYRLRTYEIAANGVFAEWAHYSSPTCAEKSLLFRSRQRGNNSIQGHSWVAPFAANIRVDIKEKTIEPGSPEGVARLQAECPKTAWTIASEQDVSATGCAEYVSTCQSEFDVMTIRGRKLTFGDRSKPLCSEATRPTKMSPWSISLESLF